jgi:hypothetical protein
MTSRSFNTAALLGAACLMFASTSWAGPLTAVVTNPGNVKIKLEQIANIGGGLVPIDAATIPGSGNLYVGTYVAGSASVRVVDPVAKTVSATPFLTFASTTVPISGQGLQGITFSPNFNDNAKPGYRKFYTYESETGPASPAANVMFRHPEVSSPGAVGVLREWTANAPGTAIDTAIASRVVLNFGTPATHMGGGLKFGPDGFLYLSTGDGGGNGDGNSTTNTTDGFTGRDVAGTSTDVPGISNGQDFTNVLGKVIRIDPYTTNADGSPRSTPAGSTAKVFSGATRYFIPGSNPFVGNPQNVFFTPIGPVGSQTPVAPLEEVFALGFRNPWKLSFDKNAVPGDAPYVADVGSRQREEILQVQGGKNYGWPYREGDIASGAASGRPLVAGNLPYLKQTSPGVYAPFDLDATLSDPTQMSGPLARIGTRSGSSTPLIFADRSGNDIDSDGIFGNAYGDANSVTGGFIYRGAQISELQGMYVFGAYQYLVDDVTRDPLTYPATSAGGRLFYFDPNEAAAYKTVKEFNFAAGFGIDATRIAGSFNALGDLLSIAQGEDGELYAMFLSGDIKRLVGPPVGDFDKDFNVDADDLNDALKGWKVRFGADLDGQSFLDWQRNLGIGLPAEANGAAAPEPTTAALATAMLVGIAGAMRKRPRRASRRRK